MKLFAKRLWAYIQMTAPVLFVGAIIAVLAAINVPLRLQLMNSCSYYVEVCEKDHVCTYTVVGRNSKQVVVEIAKWNQTTDQHITKYHMTYPLADWDIKTTEYAVCSKQMVYPLAK